MENLQIDLAEAPKMEEIKPQEIKTSELDLDLDLNLPNAPKDDTRLTTEDQKNKEITPPIVSETLIQEQKNEIPATVEPPVKEIQLENNFAPIEQAIIQIEQASSETLAKETLPEERVEQTQENIPVKTVEDTKEQTEPSSTMETEIITPTAQTELKNDMKIIDELE